MKAQQHYFGKIFWAMAPLFWGILTWFLAWGPGRLLPISYELRVLVALIALLAYFYKTLEYKRINTKVMLFDLPLPVPGWQWFAAPAIILLIVQSFFPCTAEATVLSSMAFGVFAGPILEELLARFLFIKYRMGTAEFILFNVISATTFTLMHAGYCMPMPALHDLFFVKGHFYFAFILGIIAYKTQRIEIPIIIHMLSNLFNYTLPIVILHTQLPLPIGIIFDCLKMLLLGGAVCMPRKETATSTITNN